LSIRTSDETGKICWCFWGCNTGIITISYIIFKPTKVNTASEVSIYCDIGILIEWQAKINLTISGSQTVASANWLETASTGSCSSRGRLSSDFAAAGASFLALAALAKLTAGRTVAAAAALGNLVELGVGGVLLIDELGGGVLVLSDAVREVVRDIGCEFRRSFAASRSFSTRSATSRSREDTSTGLALPNGLERGLGPDKAEVILGEERGLGVVELAVERGISSSLRLVICGVGGLEVLGDVLPRATGRGRELLLQSLSSATEDVGMSFGGPISDRPLNPPPNRLPLPSSLAEGVNLLPLVHLSSVSAGPGCPSGVENPELFLLDGDGSESTGAAILDGRLERH